MFNLLVAAGAAVVIGLLVTRMAIPPAHKKATATEVSSIAAEELHHTTAPTPSISMTYPPARTPRQLEYAIALHELRGLPPDTAPGAPLELWVAWDDAYAKEPQVQRLLRSVSVSRFIEPVTPEGPTIVVLSVPERSMQAVLYGDLYGSFSVAMPAG